MSARRPVAGTVALAAGNDGGAPVVPSRCACGRKLHTGPRLPFMVGVEACTSCLDAMLQRMVAFR